MPTDKKFTGQRLDSTGLYYYNARYYDPTIGRFISPDPIIQNNANPQFFNRYSYVLNNPLKYVDPTGLFTDTELNNVGIYYDCRNPDKSNVSAQTWDMLLKGQVGERVVLLNGETYYFFHEAQNEWDEKGVLKLMSDANGSFTNITDKVSNSALAAMDPSKLASNYQWDILPLDSRDPVFKGKSYNEYRLNYFDRQRAEREAHGVLLIIGGALVIAAGGYSLYQSGMLAAPIAIPTIYRGFSILNAGLHALGISELVVPSLVW